VAKLVYEDQGVVCEYVLEVGRLCAIGRNPTCDIRVNDPSMSRRHAEVLPNAAGGFTVRDLGSSNGTFVNGRPIEVGELTDGDELVCGEFRLRFIEEPANPLIQPPTAPPDPAILGQTPTLVRNPAAAPVTNRTQIGVSPMYEESEAAQHITHRHTATPQTETAPELVALRQQLATAHDELASLRQQLSSVPSQSEYDQLRARAQALAGERDQLLSVRAAADRVVNDLQGALAERDRAIEQLRGELDSLRATRDQQDDRIAASVLAARVEDPEERVATASEGDGASEALAAELEALRQERGRLVETFAGLRDEVLHVVEVNRQLHAEIDRVNAALGGD
jgi:pSer/pThr/pTyr-binding forkhead associated (FHA) protein/predicted nuclease with TOPRIM domain